MKIIKQGVDPKTHVYRCTCFICETEFEFKKKEAKYNSDQRDGDYLSIDCPTCKKNCTIDVRLFEGHKPFKAGNTDNER